MKKHYLVIICIILSYLISDTTLTAQTPSFTREKVLFDFDWRFSFGHPFNTEKDFNNGTGYFSYLAKAGFGDGAAAPNFDDRAWRKLDLPHDWAVEQPFDWKGSHSHGYKAIGRNFPEKSVGWYRKNFAVDSRDVGKRFVLGFDGVFRNSIVWVNGHYLGREESGYNSFSYDITEYLNYGSENVIAVRVDATMEEGWFYEGAGIYRHVWLTKTNPLHVSENGTFVVSEVDEKSASISAVVSITNETKEAKRFEIENSLVDQTGNKVGGLKTNTLTVAPFATKDFNSDFLLENVKLWDLESPYLYKMITSVTENGVVKDRYETTFGVRTIRFDAKEGFFLNGRNIKLKGTNNHQDHAGVGTAMPDELQLFRIKKLKEMGSNAYRCSHNPPTPELLDACDKLGMLVIDENRLMGTTEQRLRDLKKMIIRDRNHPSIFSWSIGNEEWGIENSIVGERIAVTMQDFTKALDSTRFVTVGISGGFRSGISSVIDVMGYNYMGNGDIDDHHKNFMNQPAMGTEEGSTFATRGEYVTNDEKHYQSAYDKKPRPSFYSIEEGWKFYSARPYLAGMFIWTGFDYRGEATPYGWPSVTSYFGMMDLCGFPKDNVYYLKSWWQDQPVLHLLPHWNWQGSEGKEIDVWAYSNCDEVELFLNKKSQGKKKMEPLGHLEWKVKYEPGTVEAIGYKGGKKILSETVKTTGQAASIKLTSHKPALVADLADIIVVTVEVKDKTGLSVPTADNEINFSVKGPGKIIGVGNGNPTSIETEKFVDEIQTIEIKDLTEKELSEYKTPQTIGEGVANSGAPAFKNRNYGKLAAAYEYNGSFELPANISYSSITFFYKSIGKEQSIFVNGKEVAKDIKENEKGHDFVLDESILKPGKNTLTIIATPIPKKNDWDNVNTNPGIIQIITKNDKWKRKLFNGYAQVIIQSTGKGGEIILTAEGTGLKPGSLKVKAEEVH